MNPILQKLTNNNKPMNMLNVIGAVKSGNADALFQQMYNSNPQFKRFADANKGKSPEQIAQENGVDVNTIRQLLS